MHPYVEEKLSDVKVQYCTGADFFQQVDVEGGDPEKNLAKIPAAKDYPYHDFIEISKSSMASKFDEKVWEQACDL